ncbi:unnamed protein product [Peniophora sp. CBMAI 1063]|nr:unnamed protein product [Peniophora sp. CBMAI 1063]
MIFSVLIIAALAARAIATPVISRAFASDTLYIITNDPQGNYVVAANIDNNSGNLTYAGITSAGGSGVHGQVDPTAPVAPLQGDATFSQGIVQVHQRNNLLATVNTADSTVVLFSIDPLQPGRLTMIGQPVPSGGTSPNSLVFNEAGDRLWVLNTGAVNGVACFAVTENGLEAQADTIRSLGLNQTTPSTGPFNTASQVLYTQGEQGILVAVKGQFNGSLGFLAVWDIDEEGNVAENFTRIATPPTSGFPFSLEAINGANAYLAADFGLGIDVYDFSEGVDNVSSSNRTTAVAIPGQNAACWTTYSELLDRYYVMDVNRNVITSVEIDSNLTVTVGSNFTADSGPIDSQALSIGEHSYLYSLLASSLQIGVWRLDGVEEPVRQSSLDLTIILQDGASLTANYTQGMAYYKSGYYE